MKLLRGPAARLHRMALAALLVTVPLAAFVALAPRASGVICGGREFVLDFTKPEEVKDRATWSDPDRLDLTPEGLGWDGAANASRDVWIESTPVAVGTSWRPTRAVSITAEVLPPGGFKFRGNQATYPPGEMYARYSPDRKHWSSWHCLEMQAPEDRRNPRQTYKGTVRVPYRETKAYRGLVREYSRMDVPWKSDEEAAVRWILERDPDFFEKSLPFVGYVQFLFETRLRGGERVRSLRFMPAWVVGGLHTRPRDPGARKERSGPWRFTSP